MRYRLRTDLAFTNEDIARLAFSYLKDKFAYIQPITTAEIEEGKFLQLEICRHDENLPCEVILDASWSS